MNGYQRIAAALRGERPDRVPVMLHDFMAAAREAGHSMREFRGDPERIGESFVCAVEVYGHDGVLVEQPEDEPALCRGARLSTLAEVEELVAQKARELRATFSDTPRFVLNAGCAIPADTPPENLRALVRAGHESGRGESPAADRASRSSELRRRRTVFSGTREALPSRGRSRPPAS